MNNNLTFLVKVMRMCDDNYTLRVVLKSYLVTSISLVELFEYKKEANVQQYTAYDLLHYTVLGSQL